MALTPAGDVFLAECRQILSRVEQGIRAAQRVAQGAAGQLIMGFEGAAHNDLILTIIRQFRSQFPDVELIMQEMPSGKQVEELQHGQVDVGLIEPIALKDGLTVAPLLSEPLVAALTESHPLAAKEHVSLRQLADEPWVTGRSYYGCGLLLRILDACNQAEFAPNVKQETNDLQMTLGFVASGLGVTLLPESSRLAQTGVIYRPLELPAPEVQLEIAWNRKSPVIESFLHVVETCHGSRLVFHNEN
ncbi:MAG: LysR family substrate-binding domain-containing protein [Cyanobacteria bacterium P01_C01_bin.118]